MQGGQGGFYSSGILNRKSGERNLCYWRLRLVKKLWAGDSTVSKMRKAPEFGDAVSKGRSYQFWLQGESKKTGEEKESEFGMEVEEGVSRNGNGSKRKIYCGKSSLWAGGGTSKSSQLQRSQNNNTDENILLRKMVTVVRNRDKFARGGMGKWWWCLHWQGLQTWLVGQTPRD